ncbi:sulfotransferase family 2 domain-containing protein [Guptibacillus algicola]|uniref:sulfotransferase family 2 domain-containing protein n=1 Tax=Guptibacillus algicola TaxID=225844 RepID=UPI001CD2E310|nr:sulfotransferase family 2 domain-containing protein [Alkalihalobacillus algicola]MCA0987887.1 sulfotransferase family protein [Alkalihalobacillus algicola]
MDNLEREVIINKLVSPPLPLYDPTFPILLFWSPKAGCTSLVKWYFYQIGLLQTATNYESIHLYRMNEFEKQPNHKSKITKSLMTNEKDIYKLVRDPYTRAVSSYFATLINPSIMNNLAPHLKDGMSFKQFLYVIRKRGVKKGTINLHIAQQYTEGEELLIKNYIRLEQFSDELKKIEKQYSLLPSPIEKIVKSPHHVAQKMAEFGEESFADIKMTASSLNDSLPTYHNFYSDETIGLVREIYKQDFENYNYSLTLKPL